MNEALRDWVTNVHDTFYIIGTAAGPHPYPELVRDFQSVIGTEARAQLLEMEGRLPDVAVAAVGGGSNAIGLFHPFLDDPVELVGVEAAGHGIDSGEHAASLTGGKPGFHVSLCWGFGMGRWWRAPNDYIIGLPVKPPVISRLRQILNSLRISSGKPYI
jgi:tryptophan synthase beta subunit